MSSNPIQQPGALRALEKIACEDSFLEFMKQGWSSIEPGSKLVVPWSLEAIAEHLEAVTAGQIKRLLINVPPGFTKSMSTSVFWPAWEWGPCDLGHHRFINGAHEQTLSIRDMVLSRDLTLSEWYQQHWGHEWSYKEDQNAKTNYKNTLTGWRKATSTGSGLTGWRGDRIILDDPHAVRDMESDAIRDEAIRWFSETLPTRLNKQAESAIIVIMQRVHARDVAGEILRNDLGYEHLCLPMQFEAKNRSFTVVPRKGVTPLLVQRLRKDGDPIPRWLTEEELAEEIAEKPLAPEDTLSEPQLLTLQDRRTVDGTYLDPIRFPEEAVEALKKVFRSYGGSYAEAGQLQQRPAPREGGMFQAKDFQFLDANEVVLPITWVRGYDLASSKEKHSPFTVGCKLGIDGRDRVIITNVERRRATPGEVDSMMLELAQRDGKKTIIDFPQDPAQAGKSQVTYFAKLLHGYILRHSPEAGSKEDRAKLLAAQAESGNLWLVRGPWNDAFITEACNFPSGDFLDQIDAATRAYARAILNRKGKRIPCGGLLIGEGGFLEDGRQLIQAPDTQLMQ